MWAPRDRTGTSGGGGGADYGPRIDQQSESLTAFVGRAHQGPVGIPTRVDGVAAFERRFGRLTPDATMGYAVRHYFANGGREALIVRVSGSPARPGRTAAYVGDPRARTGMQSLRRAPRFGMLCIPPPTRGTDHPPEVWNAAAALCEDLRVLLLVDAPGSWTTPPLAHDALLDRSVPLERTDVAAVYFPRLIMADPLLRGDPARFAPSGAVAGVIARLDASRGLWRAPAGQDASVVPPVAPEAPVSSDDDDRLAFQCVNSIRTFDGRGTLVWGARTWDVPTGSDWRYVNVRRLGFALERWVADALAWTATEPGGAPLWARVRADVVALLDGLWRRGAFLGSRPQEAFFVRCGPGQTMTQYDVDAGRLVVEVGFSALRPAEFLVLQVTLPFGRP